MVNLKWTVCTDIHTETEDWPPSFLSSMCNQIRGYDLILTIYSDHSFVVYLMHWGWSILLFLDVTFCLYSRISTLLSFHLTKAVLTLSSITISTDPFSSFSFFFTDFSGAFSTLFILTVPVAVIPFSLKDLLIEDLPRSYHLWNDNLILSVLTIC